MFHTLAGQRVPVIILVKGVVYRAVFAFVLNLKVWFQRARRCVDNRKRFNKMLDKRSSTPLPQNDMLVPIPEYCDAFSD